MKKKFSIITAVFNGERLLPRLIDSIRKQTYTDFEFIVIDGGSTDKTAEVIQKNEDIVDYWVSEKDRGIYDAWNKGIDAASGHWLLFLGCDDRLVSDALEKYFGFLQNIDGQVDFISSRVRMVDENDKPIRVKGWRWEWPKFLEEMTVAHPGSLHSRRLFDRYGKFNSDFRIVGDYEFLLRPKQNLNSAFMDEITVLMREGGASDSMRAIREHYQASTTTGGYPRMKAYCNATIIATKFIIKKALRKAGVNAYLKS
jgi:glycosyltransferase involved in cell wall biosynthesis